jgi:hypothetical protein
MISDNVLESCIGVNGIREIFFFEPFGARTDAHDPVIFNRSPSLDSQVPTQFQMVRRLTGRYHLFCGARLLLGATSAPFADCSVGWTGWLQRNRTGALGTVLLNAMHSWLERTR